MWGKMFHEQGPLPAFLLIAAFVAACYGLALVSGGLGNRHWPWVSWGVVVLAVAGGIGWLGFWIMP